MTGVLQPGGQKAGLLDELMHHLLHQKRIPQVGRLFELHQHIGEKRWEDQMAQARRGEEHLGEGTHPYGAGHGGGRGGRPGRDGVIAEIPVGVVLDEDAAVPLREGGQTAPVRGVQGGAGRIGEGGYHVDDFGPFLHRQRRFEPVETLVRPEGKIDHPGLEETEDLQRSHIAGPVHEDHVPGIEQRLAQQVEALL
ncbi:hypothetical protein SSPO_090730 [Streptomyces antimycoticus]|uniref:Uncharacterized protein n=1 Tax=Streptomyces antimycoticus TaxID=68175 RepID=A0A499UVZ9_9ACTN|nr:hypothetical protein [Streptomyces antimycoticus]BBJ46355.1 hypothetical protein SSPO_090730 [Streptomyces antimycoticus]